MLIVKGGGRLKKIKDRYLHLTFQKEASCSKAKVGKKKDKAPMKVNDGKSIRNINAYFAKGLATSKKVV